MKIKLAGGSGINLGDNLVPLFDLLVGYRETFGENAGGAKIDLSSNEELTLPAFEKAWEAIHNPKLRSATIAADVMRTLNYLGYKTCVPLMNPLPNSDTYIAFCACYTRGVAVSMAGHARLPAKKEFDRAVRIHTIIAGGEVPRDDDFLCDLQEAWRCIGRRGVGSLELFRFAEKYGEYSEYDTPLPLAVPAFWRLPSAVGMISRVRRICNLGELTRSADDPVELRAAVIHFMLSNDVNTKIFWNVLPKTREELDLWLSHHPDLSRISVRRSSYQGLREFVRLVDAEFPHERFYARTEILIAIFKDDPERYNSAVAVYPKISLRLACLRLALDPPKIAAASDPEHDSALLSRVAESDFNAADAFIKCRTKSSVFADGAWGHGAIHYFADAGSAAGWLGYVFADPGWFLVLREQATVALEHCSDDMIEYVGSTAAYNVLHKWLGSSDVSNGRYDPNVFVKGDFIVGIRAMAELVAAGRATKSDAEANLREFLDWYWCSFGANFFLEELFAADAMLPEGIVSRMLILKYPNINAIRDLIIMGAKWNYNDIREIKGRCPQIESLIA